ncbi:hypothetical protein [Collimonas fungivorans]|uniref:DUF721 domain-containing protein n=2 Tax=Collimonas fungivorans TaxID=158899 RepID=G0ADY3_COLFT|nr:hypothetical protein [Collimonas fungivorans]AEK63756.1 hypothetical protein CFU_3933 [Collimonas fungivorans Ter331]
MRRLSPSSYRPATTGSRPQTQKAVADFLRGNDKMAALLPAVTRMAALQKQCAAELPAMFSTCEVLQCEAGQLVLSAPNAALASKLKQQLPRLQNQLLAGNWQINAIRIKVQVSQNLMKAPAVKQALLSSKAVSAFSSLMEELEPSTANEALKNAIAAMVRRYSDKK